MGTLKIAKVSTSRNRTVSVTVRMSADGDEVAMGFSINFDPTILTLISSTASPKLSPSMAFNTNDTLKGTGKLGVLLDDIKPLTKGLHDLFVLKFKTSKTALSGETAVLFSDSPVRKSTSNKEGHLIPTKYANGFVRIK